MGKHVNWITYKGQQVLFMEASGVTDEEGVLAWEELRQELLKRPDTRLVLINAMNIKIGGASVKKAKEAAEVAKRNRGARLAFVGLNPLQRSTGELIAKGFGLDAGFFRTLDQGKEWLAEEDDKRR